jgi:hypothetical protein
VSALRPTDRGTFAVRIPPTCQSRADDHFWRGGFHGKGLRNLMADPKRKIQGEGDKESDRKYRERTTEFVNSEKGRAEIERAGNLSEEEAKRLRQYEEKGKARAKDEDPQIRNQSKA